MNKLESFGGYSAYFSSTYDEVSRDIEGVIEDSDDLSLEDQAKIVVELQAASMQIENRIREKCLHI